MGEEGGSQQGRGWAAAARALRLQRADGSGAGGGHTHPLTPGHMHARCHHFHCSRGAGWVPRETGDSSEEFQLTGPVTLTLSSPR